MRLERANQPQQSTPVISGGPFAANLSLAWYGGLAVREPARNSSLTYTGTKLNPTANGWAAGFGATYGAGTTDRVATAFVGPHSRRSYFFRVRRDGAGGGGFGRIFDKSNGNSGQILYVNDGSGQITYSEYYGASPAEIVLQTPVPANGTWFDVCVTAEYDGTNRNVKLYVNGALKASVAEARSAFADADTTPISIGNRASDSARVWDGVISSGFVWDGRILAEAEVRALTANPWQLFVPRSNVFRTRLDKVWALCGDTPDIDFGAVYQPEGGIRQPRGGFVRLKPNHPLAQNIHYAFLGSNNQSWDNRGGTFYDYGFFAATDFHQHYYHPVHGKAYRHRDYGWGKYHQMTESLHDKSWTMLAVWLGAKNYYPKEEYPVSIGHQSNSVSAAIEINGNSHVGKIFVKGNIYISGRSFPGGSIGYEPDGRTPVVAVLRQIHHATNSSIAEQSIWVNGVKDPVVTNTPGNTIGLSWYGSYATKQGTFLRVVWPRALTDEEIVAISKDPWQIFQHPHEQNKKIQAELGGLGYAIEATAFSTQPSHFDKIRQPSFHPVATGPLARGLLAYQIGDTDKVNTGAVIGINTRWGKTIPSGTQPRLMESKNFSTIGLKEFTVVALTRRINAGASQITAYNYRRKDGTGSNASAYIRAYTNSRDVGSTISVGSYTYRSIFSAPNLLPVSPSGRGDVVWIAQTWKGGDEADGHQLFVNNKLVAYDSGGPSETYVTGDSVSGVSTYVGGGPAPSGTLVFLFYNRRLTRGELTQLFENPYAPFDVAANEPYTIEALALDTGVATGDAAITLAASTLSSAGVVDISGNATPTLAASTLSAGGTVSISGSATPTLASATTSADGDVAIVGSGSPTLAASTVEATGGTPAAIGDAAITLAASTIAAGAAVAIAGSSTPTLANATVSATAAVSTTGDFAVTLYADTVSADGDIGIAGDATPSLAASTTSADGDVGIVGSGSPTLAASTVSATGGAPAVVGDAAITLAGATSTAGGAVAIAGVVNATFGDATVAGSGQIYIAGSLSQTLASLGLAADGLVGVSASLTATLASATLSADASVFFADDPTARIYVVTAQNRVISVAAQDRTFIAKLETRGVEVDA